jgi:hypothetical protein
MKLAYVLVDILSPPPKVTPIVTIGKECFGADDGSVICWRGVNYVRQKPSWRVRLSNWLIANL